MCVCVCSAKLMCMTESMNDVKCVCVGTVRDVM